MAARARYAELGLPAAKYRMVDGDRRAEKSIALRLKLLVALQCVGAHGVSLLCEGVCANGCSSKKSSGGGAGRVLRVSVGGCVGRR